MKRVEKCRGPGVRARGATRIWTWRTEVVRLWVNPAPGQDRAAIDPHMDVRRGRTANETSIGGNIVRTL